MKRYWVAAGTLLLSTSTIAWAQTDAKVDPASDKTVFASEKAVTADKAAWTDKSFEPAADKAALASWDSKTNVADAEVQTASSSDWNDKSALGDAKAELASWNDAKVQTASVDEAKVQSASLDGAKVQTASFDGWSEEKSDSKLQTASLDKVDQTGMGGPLEEISTESKSLDLTPRLASENYPPCSPGPGDDRCIQLYEPGVRAQLASWNEPTGGLADHSATTAMGGPYEPVDDSDAEMAAVEDDAGLKTAAVDADPQLADHSEYQGVGGPIESQSGYPACSPGPGDDRCIQMYESGVTGAGN